MLKNDRSLNYGESIIKEWVNKLNFENVLDIGSGSGRDLKICYTANNNININAIDIMDDLKFSNEKKYNINKIKLNIENSKIPIDNETQDLIIANQILEHCKEIFWIHHEMFRVLKVGGSMIIGVPNLASYYNRLLLMFGKQPYSIKLFSAHIRGFTKKGYRDFLNDSINMKFEFIDFKGANFVPFPNTISKFLSSAFPNMSTCIFFLIRKTKPYSNEFLIDKAVLETPFKLN